jgi:hypothetical protein
MNCPEGRFRLQLHTTRENTEPVGGDIVSGPRPVSMSGSSGCGGTASIGGANRAVVYSYLMSFPPEFSLSRAKPIDAQAPGDYDSIQKLPT